MEELEQNWHALEYTKALKFLNTGEDGLSKEEAEKRLARFGKNKISEKGQLSVLKVFMLQFKSPLVSILIAAALISLALRHNIDAAIIFGAVFLNSLIGFFQEYKANNILEKLKTYFVPQAFVLREGERSQIPAEVLVPGDILVLKIGDIVPADARIIKADNLEINESVLTGEAMPTEKSADPAIVGSPLGDRFSMVYAGTAVVRGTGLAAVTATGRFSEFGRLAELAGAAKEESTPLQAKLAKLGNFLGITIGLICVGIILFGLFFIKMDFFSIFVTGVAIAVSAIPEGLPVAVSVILIIGMQQILKRKSLVRKLVAAETLGSVTAICTDKTGTLTEGDMQITEIIFPDQKISVNRAKIKEESPEVVIHALKIALLCNDAIIAQGEELEELKIIGSPTEKALMQTAIQAGLNPKAVNSDYPRLKVLPFDSALKRMMTINQAKSGDKLFGGPYVLLCKGAPEIVLEAAGYYNLNGELKKLTEAVRDNIKQEISSLTSKGYRLLALAYKNLEKAPVEPFWDALAQDSVFIGMAALRDPLREEAKSAIKLCREAGIRPIIITGDHQKTAMAVAEEAGFPIHSAKAITGEILDRTDDQELLKMIKKTAVFARISPHHKLRIVKALKARGEVVAMTGDGVNDAPAIKAADIGIALGSGSEVSKESADIILLDNNLSTIVAAVEQGRVIFSNIRKVITFLLSDCFSEIILISGALFFGLPLPLLPAQILWLNIVNDGFPNFALAFEAGEAGIMQRPPVDKHEPIVNRDMKNIIFLVGIIRDLIIFIIFYYLIFYTADTAYVRTIIFASLGVKSLLSIFSLRNLHRMVYELNPFVNRYLNISISLSFALILAVVYWPPLQKILMTKALDAAGWLVVFLIGIVSVILLEFYKLNVIIPKSIKK